MKAIYVSEWLNDFNKVYSSKIKSEISKSFDIEDRCLTKEDIFSGNYKDAEVIFSTWIMPELNKEEVLLYLPKLKYIFYAAGSVKSFAKPFMECGVRVFSAWQANAIPVVEVATSEILLATKGFYKNIISSKKNYDKAKEENQSCYKGNYDVNVGILGYGAIGKKVALELKKHNINVYVYANNLSKEDEKLGIIPASLEEIFTKCDAVSNHLPDIPELYGIISEKLFNLTGKYFTFINTGRGREVDENALIKKAKTDETFIALLDVTYPEPPEKDSDLFKLDNIILTTHFAGSLGNEVVRMSEYMLNEANRILNNEQQLFEIKLQDLDRMA